MEEIGAVYGVSKLPWLHEALVSAISFKKHMPEIPIEISIDKKTFLIVKNHLDLKKYFDYVEVVEDEVHPRTLKFNAFNSSRFEKTLFLDADTFFTDRIDELFPLLESFDLVAMPAIQKIHDLSKWSGVLDVFPYTPTLFPEFNGGVVLYNNSDKVNQFKQQWLELYNKGRIEKNYSMDQASMRVALFHSRLKIFNLTPEYNFRANVPNVLNGKVKIIHAHGRLSEVADIINVRENKIRIWAPNPDLIYGAMPKNVMEHKAYYSDEENEKMIGNILETVTRIQ